MGGRTLVMGIGNTLLGDEGAGVHVIRQLQETGWGEGEVEFLDGGTLSFTLAGPLAEAEQLIVVDAAELHAPAGTVQVFEGEAMDGYLTRGGRRSVHEVGVLDLLAIGHLTGDLATRRALVGIQPAEMGWREQPSSAVAAAIPQACAAVRGLIERWRA